MEDENLTTSITFAFDNFLGKMILSPKFLSAGWEWYVVVYHKKEDGYFSVFLDVADPESLRPGLVRRVSFLFVILNQSGKEIYRTKEMCKVFCDKVSIWGCNVSLPLEERGIFETNKLIVKLDIEKVVEVVDWDEMVDFNGFQIHYSQVGSVHSLFKKHGDFTRNISVTNQLAKTRYMNLLLGLTETLNKPPHSLTDIELSNVRSEVVELTEAGLELNWLETMLDKVSLDRDTENIDDFDARVEKHIKEKVKAARYWLEGVVHSWKRSLGFALLHNEKID